ncbi:MAG TPA: DinB family protein [Thermomicrobiales bacterium]|nr:DinB family protein [Thermomicrobiales bacterium]
MNDGLIDGFRYNTWATRELLAVARTLTDEQLNATAVGAYGSIIDTLRHIVQGEAWDCARLTGEQLSWDIRAEDDDADLDELSRRVDELEERWERFLGTPFDAERTFVIPWHDGGARDVPAGIFLIGALHHGIEHRSQICTILTSLGIDPPDYGADMGPLDYAEVTNRAPRYRDADEQS